MRTIWQRLASSRWVPLVAVILSVLTTYVLFGHHPQLSRQEALDAALSKHDQETRHYAIKLVLNSEVEAADPQAGRTTGPDFYVWVIAVSGNYGIPGEYSGGRPISWGIAEVKDQRPAQLSVIESGTQGNWPPFFDRLIDRS